MTACIFNKGEQTMLLTQDLRDAQRIMFQKQLQLSFEKDDLFAA
jgi:hypothetical protein